MFGNPQWFRPKAIGYGVTPVRWQGWAYTAAWIGVIAAPFLLLLVREQFAESFAWLAVTMGALVYDVRDILKQLRQCSQASSAAPITAEAIGPERDVLYIGDNEPATSHATRNYAFRVKQAR